MWLAHPRCTKRLARTRCGAGISPGCRHGAWILYLYLIMDVWSRGIVGWRIAERESADVAAALITQLCSEGSVDPRGLVLHSDNGGPMRGSTMVSTLQWLGVIPSFSRPHVSERQSVFRGAVSHPETHVSVPATALRQARISHLLGSSLRRVVQRHTPPQRNSVRDARPASSWARTRSPRESPRAVRTRASCKPRALESLDAQLVAGRARRPQPRTHTASGCCITGATTILTLIAGMICYPSLGKGMCFASRRNGRFLPREYRTTASSDLGNSRDP